LIKTLGELFNFTNEKLLDGNLDSIDDVIEYYEECQQLIADIFPIEAPKLTIVLTSNEITKPADYKSLKKIVINSTEVLPQEVWGNVITLSASYKSGEATLYYYKKPDELIKSNLNQVPDVDSRYLPLMAKYAAKMYYLVDDDEDMREAFRTDFISQLNSIGNVNKNGKQSNYKNLW
jgi:hypothetical protein